MIKKLLLSVCALPGVLICTLSAAPPTSTWNAPFPNTTMSWDDARQAHQAKKDFTLFNPVPNDQLRYFFTDLGGTTPVTIDAGHFAVDLSPFRYSYNSTTKAGLQMMTRSYGFGDTLVKVGVCNNSDLEFGYQGYRMIKRTDKDVFAEDHPPSSYGLGDFMIRGKYNLIGNDGGPFAGAIFGQVKFPTATSNIQRRDRYQGGPGIALNYFTPCGWDLRADGSMDVDGCGEACFCQGVSATHLILPHIYGYGGFESQVQTHFGSERTPLVPSAGTRGDYEISAITGLYWQPNNSFNVYGAATFGIHNGNDAGVKFGINFRY